MTEEQLSLDDQVKKAQIKKFHAEADAISKTSWEEILKIFCAVILGLGGVVGTVLQYQISDMDGKIAKLAAKEELNSIKNNINTENKKFGELTQANTELTTKLNQIKKDIETAASANKQDALKNASKTDKPLVYIQFQGITTREFINKLRQTLNENSFNAPGSQRVAGDYASEVRYFSPADEQSAKRFAESVESFFKSNGCSLNLPVILVTPKVGDKQNPPEVWLSAKNACELKSH